MEFLKYIVSIPLMIASVVGSILPAEKIFSPNMETGLWAWDGPTKYNQQYLNEKMPILSQEGVDTIFIDINPYIDIYEGFKGKDREDKILEFSTALENFIKNANSNKIKVEALGGSRNWGNNSHRYLNELLIDFVVRYNKKIVGPEGKVEGIQFDIEPYNQVGFATNKKVFLEEYLETLEEITYKVKGAKERGNLEVNFRLGFAVPYWYDRETNNYSSFYWKNNTQPFINHVLDILNLNKNSYIAIMSYRNYTYGSDGSIAISKQEIETTSRDYPNVKVFVGQETKDFEPKKITFFGSNKSEVKRAANQIAESFSEYNSFGGVIIHDIEGYTSLK